MIKQKFWLGNLVHRYSEPRMLSSLLQNVGGDGVGHAFLLGCDLLDGCIVYTV